MSRITNAIIWKICFIVANENKHLYSINKDVQEANLPVQGIQVYTSEFPIWPENICTSSYIKAARMY